MLPDNYTIDREVTQEERFNESMIIDSAHYNETSQRSSECLFSTKILFRYFMLKCLLDAESIPSDNDNLIELFRTKLSVSEQGIYEFKTNYTADQAILFYTKYGFIYKEINEALRSINIDYLLRFRFVLKDIYNQLTHLMAVKPTDEATNVYRGQYIHFYEIFDLFNSFKQRIPTIINSFFSTSLDRQVSLGFLKAGSERNSSITSVPVLFTITIHKQDVSSDSPFADISQYSTIRDEKEILFTPGQMFMIDKFDMTYENGTFIYLINMNLYNNTKFSLNAQYSRMKSQWQEETNDSLLHLAQLLTASNRYDQAKKLYEQLLTQKSDQQTKMICYKGLREIASFMNSSDEVKAYTQKLMESKFDSHQTLSPMPDQIVVGRGFQQMLSTFMNNAQEALSQTSLDRPLQDIASYTKSNE
ncbi:unnamed protein product [Adineta steineri]|uniref:ADP ribosyltransferase domain-containing protein n=2 Tax=Adineta steineri TaxID=433720 RepID=A0A815VX51_9BILA|nr:unnamed protein product [Adineta steineri]